MLHSGISLPTPGTAASIAVKWARGLVGSFAESYWSPALLSDAAETYVSGLSKDNPITVSLGGVTVILRLEDYVGVHPRLSHIPRSKRIPNGSPF